MALAHVEWQVQRMAPGQDWVNYGAPVHSNDSLDKSGINNASAFAHGMADKLRARLDDKGKTAEVGWRVRVLRIEHHVATEY